MAGEIIRLVPRSQDDWLDKIVEEQAAYYGMSVERFTRFSSNMAKLQEQAEREGWDDYPRDEPPEQHACARCGKMVPDARGMVPCWHRDCPE